MKEINTNLNIIEGTEGAIHSLLIEANETVWIGTLAREGRLFGENKIYKKLAVQEKFVEITTLDRYVPRHFLFYKNKFIKIRPYDLLRMHYLVE